jgi:drug/metabolite transporter (DMT)-like permease
LKKNGNPGARVSGFLHTGEVIPEKPLSNGGCKLPLRNWIMLTVLGAIWGGSFLFAKVAVAEIPPFVLVFLRVSIACAVLLIILWHRGMFNRPMTWNDSTPCRSWSWAC